MRKMFVVLAVGAALALAGCGKKDEKTVYSDGANTVTQSEKGDHMTVTGQNGEKMEFGTGQGAASKLPAYAPLYPGATVTSSYSGTGKDGSGGSLAFHTTAAPSEVIAFYKDKTMAGGLKQAVNTDMNGAMTYSAASEDSKTQVSITVAKASEGGGSDGQITWSAK